MSERSPENRSELEPRKESEPRDIARFTEEQKAELKILGYSIYELTGKSIKNLRDIGVFFISDWHIYDLFESSPSMRTEAAILKKNPFLSRSGYKAPYEQIIKIMDLGDQLNQSIYGVSAVMGGAADYLEIYYKHLLRTGNNLFLKGNDLKYVCTTTSTDSGAGHAVLGGSSTNNGIRIFTHNGMPHKEIWAVPLIVPSQ